VRSDTGLATVLLGVLAVETAGSLLSFRVTLTNSDEGHNAKDCDKPLTAEYLATIDCRQCGQTGHLRVDCPERPKMICSNCDVEGHKRSECPVF
jgi:hypothetical protein